MQIIDPRLVGQNFVPPRASFESLYKSEPTKPIQLRKLRITEPTAVRGKPVYPGTTLAFDCALPDFREDFSALLSAAKAERVSIDTPLHVAPAPAIPPALPPTPAEKTPGVMELARAIVSALKETSLPKASKA